MIVGWRDGYAEHDQQTSVMDFLAIMVWLVCERVNRDGNFKILGRFKR